MGCNKRNNIKELESN